MEKAKTATHHSVRIHPSWAESLAPEFGAPYWSALTSFIHAEYLRHTVYPPPPQVFSAFNECPFETVKVVILGQDPYHGAGQAHGLSFSVPEGVPIPPSLRNMYKEIESDIGVPVPQNGNLTRWAQQGVLLLNATLTVCAGSAGSHQGKGWETFTDAVIRRLSGERRHLVFMLWGNYARKKRVFIDTNHHMVLESAHPSPLSAHRGFFGNKHFSRANAYLREHGKESIQW